MDGRAHRDPHGCGRALIDEARARELVARYRADPARPAAFHRLVGGGVEFGESAQDALLRELEEELGLRLDPSALVPLGVVENRFEVDGVPGHEIDFVFRAAIATDLIPDEGAWSTESDGSPMRVEWRPLGRVSEIPLYPANLDASPWRSPVR